MVPYTYDAATPRERVEEDVAIRLTNRDVRNDAFFAQYQAIRAWPGTHRSPRRASTMPALVIHGETDRLVPPKTDASSRAPSHIRNS